MTMQSTRAGIIATTAIALAVSLTFVGAIGAGDQKTFATPQDATTALVAAARAGDRPALEGIFGAESHDLFFSGDDVADLKALANFAEWADESTELTENEDDTVDVVVGEEEWPLPMPLVKSDAGWRFDTAAGKEELINRRIGANELSAIDVCRAFVDAQMVYASQDRDGDGVKEFASKILSDDGKKNGLFWNAAKHGGEPSPIGPLAATASDEGYKRKEAGKRMPFHGYVFRILAKQGKNAPGGKKDYMVKGNMTGGFAVLAHPAEYGVSGIMTFVINRHGILFQKDLGKKTESLASTIDAYDPDDSWSVVKD
jgi:hypothetical protein